MHGGSDDGVSLHLLLSLLFNSSQVLWDHFEKNVMVSTQRFVSYSWPNKKYQKQK